MSTLLRRTTPVALLASAALVAGLSGGAVAGSMITGAQIKDGTISSKDILDRSIKSRDLARSVIRRGPRGLKGVRGAAGASGYLTKAATSANIPSGGTATVKIACPTGRVITGAVAGWNVSPTPTSILSGDTFATAKGVNTSGATDTLTVHIFCIYAG